jgi:ATP-dependent Lhr-like helicase
MSTSPSFERLHPRVQEWVWQQGWSQLRHVQEQAIPAVLDASGDVIIAAATAGGKTEAAFLPICSRLLEYDAGLVPRGVLVLYVSPLKALINDQFDRLEELCRTLDIPVHRWHGDVASSQKKRALTGPGGLLLITPESLEALFVLRGTSLRELFEPLTFVVVDELHAFIGSERGKQLQSLLDRVDRAADRVVPRVALSATLGDMRMAAEFLRHGGADAVSLVEGAGGETEIRLQIRGCRVDAPTSDADRADAAHADVLEDAAVSNIGDHIFTSLRGSTNLVFANSRRSVEAYADYLHRACERAHVPSEFVPHHGSLSKELREDTERRLKARESPVTAVCTSTLEMGVDIGAVASVAQIGVPPSVSSMRQRLGRSGRRGDPATLRMYIEENTIVRDQPPQDHLRIELVQAIAMVRLLARRWCEPPEPFSLHISTLAQQLLSTIAQHGGASPREAWIALCKDGAFSSIDQMSFAALLRALASHDLIVQSPDGALLLGAKGEQIVNHYSFYAAFSAQEEFRLMWGGRELGTLPVSHPLYRDAFIIFGGRRWRIVDVDAEKRVIDLEPSPAGRAPRFTGGGTRVHDGVRREMREVYLGSDEPAYVDASGRALLAEGRDAFERFGLRNRSIVNRGLHAYLFCWRGDRVLDTIVAQLRTRDVGVDREGATVVAAVSGGELHTHCRALAEAGHADPIALAAEVRNKIEEKYHGYVGDDLLARDYASRNLDTEAAWQVFVTIAAEPPPV